ncbi:NmrA family NAD(P)-binding protein [Nonomuraea gerenzanensis]|uniref:NmrA family NAD(P)-binding protein n=1 Tax=Nonomuraea gerenzanensis TaxID=93944 RepID=UPI001CD9A7BF|nr:NmrA family NAD(P)-binding protein [Nonomuraea gerenzanensis]UBU11908.1 NmrA family NAD(P)-binding protein [Nonomuraea gerenzanensis]
MTYLVTGATGSVGRHVVAHLLDAGHRVRALTRDLARAKLPEGVEVVRGDLSRTESIVPALKGVEGVHLIDAADSAYAPLQNGAELVEAVRAAGVSKVTLLSGWSPGTLEAAVTGSDLAWTYVQPTEFMANALAWAEPVRTKGLIEEPFAATRTAMVHEADIGAVIATALTEDGHAGHSYGLTGPELLDVPAKVRILSEAIGREIAFRELTVDEMRERYRAEGVPEQLIEFQIQVFGNVPEGAYQVTATVEQVTGRPPRTFAQWAAEHAEWFSPGRGA